MATRTFTANKDARIADNGGTSLGAGASDFLPVGLYSGFLYRSLIGFSYSFADMVTITSAILHIKTSSQYYVAFGSDPDVEVRRITSSWSEGTAVSLSGSNAVEWSNKPSVTSTHMATFDVATTENTWDTVDITDLINDAFAAGTFLGIELRAVDEGSASDVTEFYAREYGSNDAYIVVTYTTNTLPSAPSLTSPSDTSKTSLTPSFVFTHNDAQGDACASYDLQVSTDSTFASVTHWDDTNDTTGISGTTITRSYAGTGLSYGTTYYWRARTNDGTGDGTWSATRSFTTYSKPTSSVTTPTSGHTAKTYYTAGSNTTPHLEVSWSFSDADGHAQASASIKIYADSSGSPGSLLHTHSHSGSATTAQITGFAPTNGTKYHISVTPTCSASIAGDESSKNITRVRWGRASYYYDFTTAPASLGSPVVSSTVPANSYLTIEYAATASTTEPTTWYSTLAAAGTARYLWHRVTMSAYGSATPTGPTLNSIVLVTYNSANIPDNWTLDENSTVDTSTFVYGSQSLKIAGDGTSNTSYQNVDGLTAGLAYIFSGRIKSLGNSGAKISVYSADGTTLIAETDAITATQDFGEQDADGNDISKVYTSPFIAPSESVRVVLTVTGAASTYAWFDALKLEQSTVVTPWTPGYLGAAVVDAGGVQVDGSKGGVFRLRPSDPATYEDITLDDSGFKFDEAYIYKEKGGDLWIENYEDGGNIELYAGSGGDINLYGENVTISPNVDMYIAGFPIMLDGDVTLTGDITASGTIDKIFNPLGVGVRMPAGGLACGDTYGTSISLAANGGSCVTWMYIPFPVRLQSWLIRNGDTASARNYEIALFKDTHDGGSNTLTKVAESYASESFTPSAASTRTPAVATPDTIIQPGVYCVVIRNKHATNTFNLVAKAAGTIVSNNSRTKTLATALSSTTTLDIATSWSSSTSTPAIVLEGRNFGASWAW